MSIQKRCNRSDEIGLPGKSQLLAVIALESEVSQGITLTAEEVRSFNHARKIYDELRGVLFDAVMPAIGGSHHPVSVRLYDLMQELHLHSGGMLARHRQAMERMDKEREVEA